MFFIFIFTRLQTNFHYICTNFTDRKSTMGTALGSTQGS